METVTLGATGIAVSRVAFGSDPIGGHGWGGADDDAARDAIASAIDSGITLFDTADCYGKGRAESLIGEVIRGRRDRIVLASKFGVRFADGKTYYDNSPAWIARALDGSLKRLGVDCLDLYQLHWWDGKTPFAEVARVLQDAAKAGKIRSWGVTNVAIDPPLPGTASFAPSSFSSEYSLANRKQEGEILRTVAATGATFMAWGSLGQGILTGKYGLNHAFGADDRRSRSTYPNFSAEGRMRNMRIVDALREMQPRYPGRSIAQLALRWILDRVPGSVVLVGAKRAQQAADNAGAMGWALSPQDDAALEHLSRAEEAAA